jgi:hypothetical protein
MSTLSLGLVRNCDFRRLAATMALNSIGMMGETVVLGWLTLELTNSPFLVGLAMAARSMPAPDGSQLLAQVMASYCITAFVSLRRMPPLASFAVAR